MTRVRQARRVGDTLSPRCGSPGSKMPRFSQHSIEVEARRWHEEANHAAVVFELRYRVRLDFKPGGRCGCGPDAPGWIDIREGGHGVCSGDWIMQGPDGACHPCPPDLFDATYTPVEPAHDR